MTVDQKWQYVLDQYRKLISKNGWFTESEKRFVDKVNQKCFTRVYMIRPSNHMIEVLYALAKKQVLKL